MADSKSTQNGSFVGHGTPKILHGRSEQLNLLQVILKYCRFRYSPMARQSILTFTKTNSSATGIVLAVSLSRDLLCRTKTIS